MKADGPIAASNLISRTRLIARTYLARGVTKALPPSRLARIEHGPLRHAIGRGSYRLPFGIGRGLLIDAASLSLASAQARSVLRGLHEPQVSEALRRCVGEGGTFLDIGAHIGYMTMLAAHLAGPTGTVLAIEPVPRNAEAIRRNATLNGFGQVRVTEAAASHSSGQEDLITTTDTIWTRLASVGDHPYQCRRAPVRTVSVDDLVESGELPGVPDVVKIDVEGAEIDVLEGMRRTLASRQTTVICEMHGKNDRFADLMDELGYVVTNLDGPGPIETAGGNDHALAQPR